MCVYKNIVKTTHNITNKLSVFKTPPNIKHIVCVLFISNTHLGLRFYSSPLTDTILMYEHYIFLYFGYLILLLAPLNHGSIVVFGLKFVGTAL